MSNVSMGQKFQVNRNKAHKGNNIFEKTRNYSKKQSKSEKLMNGIGIWTSFYRANPHRFVQEYLGIHLKWFQVIIFYMMNYCYYFMYLAARGQGKTYITAIYTCVRCILYPGTKVIVASGTKGQALEVISKITDLKHDSPNLAREISDIRDGANDPRVEFHNGSWIRVVAANSNARSKRANLLIIDEFRMVDLDIINNVLRKFLTAPRQPRYLQNTKYEHLKERNKEIYLSSCWYKMHWSYQRFLAYVKAMMNGKNYFVCGLPYQLSISTGLLMKEQIQDEMTESDFDEVGFSMENGCLWWGESEKAYFKFEYLEKNRVLFRPLYPKPMYDLIRSSNFKQEKKKDGELRLLSCDIALMQGKNNDASIYTLYRLIPTKYGYDRYISTMESLEGVTTDKQALKIKQLFYDYDCDYVDIDTNGSGIGVYDQLIIPISDPERGVEYDPWTCINDQDMADRCDYPNAQKIIYSIKANNQLNSIIAMSFKDNLFRKKIKLLVNETDGKESLKSIKGFDKLPLEEQVKFTMPFLQTTFFVNETINLENVDETGTGVKLKEPAGKRKDRYSSASYGNYIANILEKKFIKPKGSSLNIDSLFQFKQPKTI
jgi:hypothetical protein